MIRAIIVGVVCILIIVATSTYLVFFARRPTPLALGTPPATPPTRWEKWKCWWQTHWTRKEAKIIPITVCVLLIDYILFTEWPTLVWGPVSENGRRIILMHVFYIVALTCMSIGDKWKSRTAMILLMLSVLTATTVLNITPWAGEEWWLKKPTTQAATSTTPDRSSVVAKTEVRYIIAPVDKPSDEMMDTLQGARIDPEGPIWVVDQNNKPHECGNDKEYTLPRMQTARFQSRTTEAVKVRITVTK